MTSDDSNQGTINSLAKKRIEQAKQFGYLGYIINSPIMHLTSGELTRIITSDSYWKYFSRYFPMKKEIVRIKLDEVGTIRNALAHFRPIQHEDVEVVKQNCKNILKEIEIYISEMLLNGNSVPSNTEDTWYKNLSEIDPENCELSLSFLQSKNGQWVKLNINFKCPILKEDSYGDTHRTYHILNITTSKIVTLFHSISKYSTYVSDQKPYYYRRAVLNPDLTRKIYINFHRSVLEKHHEEIKSDLKDLFKLISSEIDLIKNDNLAKGKMLDLISCYAYLTKEDDGHYWNMNNSSFDIEVRDIDPTEYWGEFPTYVGEFTKLHKFPWMPVDISDFDIFS